MELRYFANSCTRNMGAQARYWWSHLQICWLFWRRRGWLVQHRLHGLPCYGPKTIWIRTGNSGPRGQPGDSHPYIPCVFEFDYRRQGPMYVNVCHVLVVFFSLSTVRKSTSLLIFKWIFRRVQQLIWTGSFL